ncbi:hypothetical protein ACGF5F_29500 [Streptomyces sp. NPDC047821]|uniref:hypothetical protein n=1 Tax=Streptomyces sp. NPDC047821 TaxID=3365488 RepID=UPI003721C2D7
MQHIIARVWYGTGQYVQRSMSPGEWATEMCISRQAGETSYRWTGEDRNGARLHVVWIVSPKDIATLVVFELSLEPTATNVQARLERELMRLDGEYERATGHNAFLYADHGAGRGPGEYHFTDSRVMVGVRSALAHMRTLMHDLATELERSK